MSENDAHIQDSQILAMSKQEANERGMLRFLATLPSGREVATGWFDPGKKREMMQTWLAGVRAELVKDEEEAKAAMRRRLSQQDAQNDALSAAQKDLRDGSTTPQRSNADATPAARMSRSPQPASSPGVSVSDPSEFVRQEYVKAAAAAVFWRGQLRHAEAEFASAEFALAKWKAIGQSLGVVLSEANPAADGSVSAADGVQPSGGGESA